MDNLFSIPSLEKVIFLGSSPIMNDLISLNEGLSLETIIITSPDQSSNEWNAPTHVFEKLDDSFTNLIEQIVDAKKTLFVSMGARWIFKESLITKVFCNNLVNFHGARLPFDAGGGGFSWRIMNGDRINNMLVHLVDKGVDTGDILYTEASIFPSHCKIPQHYIDYYLSCLPTFYKKFLTSLLEGKGCCRRKQVDYIGTYYPRLNTDKNGWIDWSWSGSEIERFICAFDNPYAGASTFINGCHVKVKSVHLHCGEPELHSYMKGLVVRHDGKWIVVSAGHGQVLLIEKCQTNDGESYLDKIKVGDRFCTPVDKIHESQTSRAIYTSKGLVDS